MPRYILPKFEKDSSYMQTKRSQGMYYYYYKEGIVSYYMGEIPIRDKDKNKKKAIKEKALEKIDANIAGVVVNRTPKTKRGRYSNYYDE